MITSNLWAGPRPENPTLKKPRHREVPIRSHSVLCRLLHDHDSYVQFTGMIQEVRGAPRAVWRIISLQGYGIRSCMSERVPEGSALA